jgi:hypothetical protein
MSAHQSRDETLEHAGLSIGLAAARSCAVVVLSLLVCPPPAIRVIAVTLPLVALAALLAIAAVPFLLLRHLRGDRDYHTSLVLHRLRRLRGAHA